jgi:pimeloyl-ACP methyl ester carboxylesterase
MFIGSERCILTTLRRSKGGLQARRDKRLGRIADFLRLMTRPFKCSFSTIGKFEPSPPIPLVDLGGRGENASELAGGRLDKSQRSEIGPHSSAMSATKAVFVLIHGGWHNHSAWDRVTPILRANGFAALTLDLPGAGINAIAPTSLGLRPFDPAAFAAERSPIAGVTQEERTQAVVALVKEGASLSDDGKVILVGHSAGGMTLSAVAEQVPNLLLAVVYLAGFMVPNGMSLLAMLRHETLSSALAPGLFVGDPVAIGATRIHVGSTDEAYRSLLKAAFYGDVSDSDFAHAASQLHCDESNSGAVAPSEITPGRFGTVPRHYIRCTQDRAIPLTGQDHMIATVDGAIGGKTMTHTLKSSHSPFLSQPANLSRILIDICVQSLAEQNTEAP